MLHPASCLVFAALFAANASEYTHCVPISVTGYTGSAPLTDFPVLVRLADDSPEGFSYADCETDGSDIRFVDANNNPLSFEIDTWNAQGESCIWVKLPSMSASTTFEMRYGGTPTSANTPSATWSAFGGVWHMGEASGVCSNAAPTGAAYDATPKGNTANSVLYNGADAPVGGARRTATDAARGYLSVPNYDALGYGDSFTASCWVRLDKIAGGIYHRVLSRKTAYDANEGWEIHFVENSGTGIRVRGAGSTTGLSAISSTANQTWTYLTFAYNGTTVTVYQDGALVGSGTIGRATDNGRPLAIGCNSNGSENSWLRGSVDECRLMDGAVSADWAGADYKAQKGTLLTLGAAGVPTRPAATVSVSPLLCTSATVSALLDAVGDGASSATFSLAYGTDPANLPAPTVFTNGLAAGQTAAAKLTGLQPVTTYYYALTAVNDAATPQAFTWTGSFTTPDYGLPSATISASAGTSPPTLAITLDDGGAATCDIYLASGADATNLPAATLVADDAVAGASIAPTIAVPSGAVRIFYQVRLVNGQGFERTYDGSFIADSSVDFTRRIPFSVTGYTGASTLTNFPVLVRLADGTPSAFFHRDCEPDGSDIHFVDANGNPLAFEIDTWDPQGESCVWVKLPEMASGTAFEMRYGGTPVSANAPTNTWDGYIGVWHFSEPSGNVADATGHGLDAIEGGDGELAATHVVGGARLTTQIGDRAKGEVLAVRDFVPEYGGGTVFTASGWFIFPDATANAYRALINKKTHLPNTNWDNAKGWYLEMSDSLYNLSIIGAGGTKYTTAISHIANNWQYFTLVSNGQNVKLYVNGVKKIDQNHQLAVSTSPMSFVPTVGGVADEYRYRGDAVSPDWALADYKSQTRALLTAGAAVVETRPVTAVTVSPVSFTTATVSALLETTGDGASSATVSFACGTDAANLPAPVTLATGLSAGQSVATNLTGLADGTTYHYEVSAVNDAATPQSFTFSGSFTTPAYGIPSATVALDEEDSPPTVSIDLDDCGVASESCDIFIRSGPDSENLPAWTLVADDAVAGDAFDQNIAAPPGAVRVFYQVRLVNDMGVERVYGGSFAGDLPVEFTRRLPITVTGYSGSALTDFPALVRLAEGNPAGFSYAHCNRDGSDIRFADADGIPIPFEIDKWDPEGESCIWVKLPALTSSTTFEMRYGGNPASANTPAATWSDYIAVWHFSEEADLSTAADATGHGYDAVESGTSIVAAESIVGNARQRVDYSSAARLLAPDYEIDYPEAGTVFTASGWFKFPGQEGTAYRGFLDKKGASGAAWNADPGWYFMIQNGTSQLLVYGPGGATAAESWISNVCQNWNHFTIYSTGSEVYVYINGVYKNKGTLKLNRGNIPLLIMPYAGGVTDEYRIRPGTVSADWISADYKSQTGALLTLGAPSYIAEPILTETTSSASFHTASLSARLSTAGAGAAGATVTFAYGTDPEDLGAPATLASGLAAGGTATADLADLADGMTYFYAFTAENDANPAQSFTVTGSFTTKAFSPPVAAARHTNLTTPPSVVVDVEGPGAGAASCDVFFTCGPDPEALPAETRVATGIASSASVTNAVAVAGGARIHYRVRVVNDIGAEWTAAGSFIPAQGEYGFRIPIKVMGYSGAALTDFPVLVRLTEGFQGFSYNDCAADGSDIRFADASGNALAFEIDTWNPDGESCVWVKLPSMQFRTFFEMRYGGAPSNANTPSDVWTAFGAVWHMNENAASQTDRTGNGLTATVDAGVTYELADGAVGAAVSKSGILRAADFFASGHDYTVPSSDYSVSAWYHLPGYTGAGNASILIKGTWQQNGWVLQQKPDYQPVKERLFLYIYQTIYKAFPVKDVTKNWNYVTLSYAGGTFSVYVNGALAFTQARTANLPGNFDFIMGSVAGLADETRVKRSSSSTDWAAADYATQTGTLLEYGVEQDYVEIVATPEEFGEPSPAYGKMNAVQGQTYTFTAPASGYNAVGAKSATCTGWNLYREDATVPFRTSADDGETALSCTVEYSEPVRLEWTWGSLVDHGWRYDGSGSTKLITELEPPDGGPAWIITCTVSGRNLTLTGVQQVGTNAVLNLALPVTDANGVPYSITATGSDAFKGRNTILDLRLPDTLTSIGTRSFQNCRYVAHVRLPGELKTLNQEAFAYCVRLRTAEPFLPASLTTLGDGAFRGCSRLASPLALGHGTTAAGTPVALTLNSNAFRDCPLIPSMAIGPGVASIPNYFAYQCYGLKRVTLHDALRTIGDYAFDSCTTLETVEPLLPAALTQLGVHAFYNAYRLTGDVYIGTNAVCTLGEYAFSCWQNGTSPLIEKLVLGPGVTSVPQRFCDRCKRLSSITLDDGITAIGAYAFFDCDALTSILLPANLKSISEHAFDNCGTLETVEPFLPASVTSVGAAAFINCPKLRGDLVIAPGGAAATIGEFAFSTSANEFNASRITSVSIGDGVTAIPQYMCYRCPALTNVHLPANLKTISNFAFDGCGALETVEPFLPPTVTTVGDHAFSWCSKLRGDLVIAPGGAAATIGEYAFGTSPDQFYAPKITSLTMGDGVTAIKAYAFYDCEALTNIVLSATLKTIGERAFDRCAAVVNITPFLPATVTSVGNLAFSGCSRLVSPFVADGVASRVTIGDRALNWCPSLSSAAFSTNVATLPSNLFIDSVGRMRTLRFDGKPTWSGNPFAGFGAYQTRFIVPADDAGWTAFVADTAKATLWDNLTEAQRQRYLGDYPGEPPARALTKSNPANQWIVSYAATPAGERDLVVGGAPGNYAAGQVSPAYGTYTNLAATLPPPVALTAPQYADEATTRYVCAGYRIEPATPTGWGAGTDYPLDNPAAPSATYTPADDGQFRFLWLWSPAGHKITIANAPAPSIGTAEIAGADADGYIPAGATATVTAVPASAGVAFTRWYGDVPEGHETDATLQIVMDGPKTLTPEFASGWVFNESAHTLSDGNWVLGTTAGSTRDAIVVNTVKTSYALGVLDLRKGIVGGGAIVNVAGWTFRENKSIREVRLPDTLRAIGDRAFENCTALTTVTPLLPGGVTALGSYAFNNCTALTGELSLGTGGAEVTLTEGSQFHGTKITGATLGSGVRRAPWNSFQNCTKLGRVEMSHELASIESYAFDGCTALTNVVPLLPAPVTFVGRYAFNNCKALTGHLFLGTNGVEVSFNEGYQFNGTKITGATLGSGVKKAPWNSFQNCTQLGRVEMSHELASIESYAFDGCTALTNVVPLLPASVTSVGRYVFNNCTALTDDLFLGTNGVHVTLNTDGYLFYATKITGVTFGGGVTNVPRYSFQSCTKLGRVKMTDAVTTISANAFRSCSALTDFEPLLPASLFWLGDHAFTGCTKLTGTLEIGTHRKTVSLESNSHFFNTSITNAIIGPGVARIPDSFFSKEDWMPARLASLTLDSVPAIGASAFLNATAVRDVWFKGDPPTTIGSKAFSGWNVGQSRLHLPNGNDAWRDWAAANATPWPNLTDDQRDAYWDRWPARRKTPYGRTTTTAVPASQWVLGWTPGSGTVIILR